MVVVGFTGFKDENPQGFFPGFKYMSKFVVLHHDVLHMVPYFLDDDRAESVGPCCLEGSNELTASRRRSGL